MGKTSGLRTGHALVPTLVRSIVTPWAITANLLALALAITTGTAAESTGEAGGSDQPALYETITPSPGLTNLRYSEDYTYLRNPANRTGAWWEPFKYIPLDASRTSFLTLGLELRFWEQAYWNFNWGEVPVDNYQWHRVLPYADLHLGPNVRLFGQMIGAWVTGKETGISGVDETGFELLQGFGELKLPLSKNADLTLSGGRQLLSYGSERLISLRYGPNVLRSFDAGVASLQAGLWRIDAFYARPVRNRVESFNDRFDGNRLVWSLYATRKLDQIGPASGLDLYYIGNRNADAKFNQGAGEELRHTIGSRFFGKAQDWDWNFEAIVQFGKFGGGDIRAWSVASDTGYTFTNRTFSPRLGLRANIISGDRNPNNPDLQTVNPLFPRGNYFGEIGLIGPINLINLHPNLTLHLNNQWTLSGGAVLYWRESLGDGIYGNGGNIVRSAGGSRARYIGTQADLVLGWKPVRWFGAELAYSVFTPGKFIEDTGPSKTAQFVSFGTVVKF
jgi:hypothetical protein